MPARLHRYYGPDSVHFITTNCYQRFPWLDSACSRNLFLETLEQVRRRYRFVVVGYVVMPEHVHLLLSEPERGDPSVVMQVLKQGFARTLLRELRAPNSAQQRASLGDSDRRGTYLATALLRFRGEYRAQARGEVALYAPQPGAARSGSRARSVEMGQLSRLCARTIRTSLGQ
jgi:REP element-mobilizing transposase RayT